MEILNELFCCRTWSSCMWTLTSAGEKSSTMKIRDPRQTPPIDIQRNQSKKPWPFSNAIHKTYSSSQSATIHSMMLVSVFSRWMVIWEYASLRSIFLRNVFMTQKHLLSSNHWQPQNNAQARTISQLWSAKTTSTEGRITFSRTSNKYEGHLPHHSII